MHIGVKDGRHDRDEIVIYYDNLATLVSFTSVLPLTE